MTGEQEYLFMLARCRFLGIVLVLIAAAALRLWGLRWGLPDSTHLFSYHPDEFHSLRGVLSLAAGDLNPHFFNYGSLYLYLVSALCVIAHSGLVFGLDTSTLPEAIRVFTLDARIISAVAGVATVYVVYLIGRRLASERTGLVAAAALAVMPLHVLNCHYGTVDVTETLFIALCLYFTLGIIEGEGIRAWVLAGAMAGLAASTKYNGILVVIAPVIAVAAGRSLTPSAPDGDLTPLPPSPRGGEGETETAPTPSRLRRDTPPVPGGEKLTANGETTTGETPAPRGVLKAGTIAPREVREADEAASHEILESDEAHLHLKRAVLGAFACFGAALVAFAVTSPYTFLAWNEAWSGIAFELQHMRDGEWTAIAIWPSGWLFHLYLSVCLFPVAFALTDRTTRHKLTPMLVFGALWYVVISLAKVRYARYGVPLDIVAALAIALLWPRQWRSEALWVLGQWLACAGLSILMLGWLMVSAQRDDVLTGPTTQDQMLTEVLQRVPPGERVGMVWEPWFNMPPVDYCNGGAALRGNRLWAQFKRPARPIVVTGLDVETLRDERPYAFVAGDVELFDAVGVDPKADDFWQALFGGHEYRDILQTAPTPWPPDSLNFARPATDTCYPCPHLHLCIRDNRP